MVVIPFLSFSLSCMIPTYCFFFFSLSAFRPVTYYIVNRIHFSPFLHSFILVFFCEDLSILALFILFIRSHFHLGTLSPSLSPSLSLSFFDLVFFYIFFSTDLRWST